jgi:hypothetical protein
MQSRRGATPLISRYAHHLGRCLVALTLGAGTAGFTALLAAGPPAGASVATPSLIVSNDTGNTLLTFPFSATGDVAPSATISSNAGSLDAPTDSVFDGAGDLWVATGSGIAELTPSQLASSGDPTPTVVIQNANQPSGLAFDSTGDLWATQFNGGVVEYTANQLTASGNPTPAVSLTGPDLQVPWGLTFDSSGNLWVGTYIDSVLVEYTKGQLAATGNPAPAVTISGLGTAVVTPAFDSSGDLWVSTYTSTPAVIEELTPSELAATGSPTPAVTIATGTNTEPVGLAFDTTGDLWVGYFGSQTVNEFTRTQLDSSGAPTPANTIGGSNTTLANLTGLTLNEAPVVTTLTPAAGTSGATVTINGAGFLYGSSVDFGSTPATSVTYVSPYELQATAPGGSGVVDVTVTTGAGTSATSSADQFTYTNSGYVLVASDGGVFNYGAPFYGSQGGKALNAPIVGITDDAATGGYWEVAADGGVFGFNAPFMGSMGGRHLNAPIVAMAATADGGGYWLVAKDGGIFAYGDAKFLGSRGGQPLNAPVVGIAADAATGGYWEVAADGGIFNYGAPFLGSRGGQPLNAPIVGVGVG